MEDLQVHGKLTAMVIDDENANAATARLESLGQAGPKIRLINDGNGLLDITGLGHSHDSAFLEIEDTILLEDWAKHSLNNNTWARVGDEGRLFMQLLGEEVHSQVSVLAGGS
jgi:hypothetical protein